MTSASGFFLDIKFHLMLQKSDSVVNLLKPCAGMIPRHYFQCSIFYIPHKKIQINSNYSQCKKFLASSVKI